MIRSQFFGNIHKMPLTNFHCELNSQRIIKNKRHCFFAICNRFAALCVYREPMTNHNRDVNETTMKQKKTTTAKNTAGLWIIIIIITNADQKAFGFLINFEPTLCLTFVHRLPDADLIPHGPPKCKRLNVEAILLGFAHLLSGEWNECTPKMAFPANAVVVGAIEIYPLGTCIFITIMTICIANRIMHKHYLRTTLTSKLFKS